MRALACQRAPIAPTTNGSARAAPIASTGAIVSE